MTSAKPIRILLVDDHAVLRESLASMLALDAAFEIIGQAGNASEAIQLHAALKADITLLDVRLPGKDGFYVLEQLLQTNPQARVILFASSSLANEVRRARDLGAHGFLPKQVTLEQLSQSILQVHEGKKCWEHSNTVPQPLMEALSARELETLDGLRRGLTNVQIAKALGISEHTVKHHVKAVCGKLDTSDRTEAVARAFELGLL
ncbi:MAG: response regulator transcription factor [Verrucomicrobiaceae bacterium]|nr:response regulator transcription factor [Verrucomicrobiaceae bacterium]